MYQPNDINSAHKSSSKATRFAKRGWIMAGVVAVAASAMTFAVANDGLGMHGHGMHGAMNPAAMDEHIASMVEHCLADGTPDQKARVTAIAKGALNDLRPLHKQMDDGHAKAIALLSQPSIDRRALEALRVEEMQQADIASKRIVQAVEDAAEVLTPSQRVKLSEQLMKRHDM